jgi:O-succinylbenzoate synthase
VFATLAQVLVPAVLHEHPASYEDLRQLLDSFRGNSPEKSALDAAWRDAEARIAGKPLWQALGGTRDKVRVTPVIWPQPIIEHLFSYVAEAMQANCEPVTIKLRPGWGLEVIRALREVLSNADVSVDFDGTASLDQRDLLFRLQDYRVGPIEQPLDADDLVGHAMLQEALRTRIRLDQSITSVARATQAIDLGACGEIRVRLEHVGGLAPALDIAKVCEESDRYCGCTVGVTARTEVGLRHALALASHERFDDGLEIEGPRGENEPFKPYAPLWIQPGIGVEPSESMCSRMILSNIRLTPDP